jgi:hypothetical protein
MSPGGADYDYSWVYYCGDGTVLQCAELPPQCAEDERLSVANGCYTCMRQADCILEAAPAP